jgi:hypothetical protein
MANITDQHYQQLLDSLFAQAKYFLEEAGEFYPYGSVLDADLQIRPLGFFSDKEYPEAKEVLMQLETAVKEGLKNGKYLAAVIGVDVSVATPEEGSSEKRHALQLHNYRGDEPVFIRYSIYEQTDEGYAFGPLFEL